MEIVIQPPEVNTIRIIDSHTGGEPTRVVIGGFPDLGLGSIARKQKVFQAEYDHYRQALVNEPRGSDIQIGALLVPSDDPLCLTGVIFFNNIGYLGMCGHGTMGILAVLSHLGKINPGPHRLDTSVGIVTATLHEDGSVSVQNVPGYRYRKQASVQIDGEKVSGDIAWGGNWFFLCDAPSIDLIPRNTEALIDYTWKIRHALCAHGITGKDGQEIDHIELSGPSPNSEADSRNFVLCPGKAYDRSPCGTGTSAKLCCLFKDGKLKQGQIWRQESIVGTIFEGSIKQINSQLIPTIKGIAFVNATTDLILNPEDPFCWGIPTE